MWQVLRNLEDDDPDLAQSSRQLFEETTRTLVLAVGGLYLLWHMIATTSGPDLIRWHTWIVSGLIGLICLFVLILLPHWPLCTQLLWHGGMLAALTLAIYLFQWPHLAIFYALLPLSATISIGWIGGLFLEGLVLAVNWWLAFGPAPILSASAYGLLPTVAGLVSLVLGWASANSWFTVVHWTSASFAQARRNMEEARQHRAQLAQLLKDLDRAYYQLERANAALTAARKTAEEAERFKTEFVTNVSHELRTPLNLIVGFSEVMMLSPESYSNIQLPGPYRSDLEAIYHSAQHLLALVDDVLDLARIEVGKIALAREEVNLAKLVEETCAIVRDYIAAKGLELRIYVATDLQCVWIDRLRIRQVLLNLLVNAARHTKQGWIAVDVTIEGDEVVVKVTDTGEGIPAQDLPHIFEEFRTTERPFSEWHSGTGLGLPISKKYVELHHGRMGVESTQGVGTTFWFTLPYRFSYQTEQFHHRGRYQPLVRLGTSERIVIMVHPDPSTGPLLRRYLDGYRILSVQELAEGIALAKEHQAIAVLVDSTIPIEDPPPHLLFIHISLPSNRLVAQNAGAMDMLIKPVSRRELLEALDCLQRPIGRILIVDDDPEVVRLFRRMLQSRPSTQDCREAYNGQEALDLMRQEKPDLVLLDLMMPQVDGRTVLTAMAADPDLAEIPVILVSARGQDHVNLRLMGPIQVYRRDGFELGELVQTVSATLNALSPGWHSLETREQEL